MSKNFRKVLETKCWWATVPSSGASQIFFIEITFKEGTKNILFETANLLYSSGQKTNAYATEQASWHFLTTVRMNFFTQFSPKDPFDVEAYENTKKPFS